MPIGALTVSTEDPAPAPEQYLCLLCGLAESSPQHDQIDFEENISTIHAGDIKHLYVDSRIFSSDRSEREHMVKLAITLALVLDNEYTQKFSAGNCQM